MKCELDASFVLKAKERAVARAETLHKSPQAKKAAERGRKRLEDYQREHMRRKKAVV